MTNFKNSIFLGDNLTVLQEIPSELVDLIYIDPPFNTGRVQTRPITKMTSSKDGNVTGYNGKKYNKEVVGQYSYRDTFEDFEEFLRPRIIEAYRILKPTGTFYFHIDYREVHYMKVELDKIFGRGNFLNEVIWAYDYGAKSTKKWPAKHDNILVYVKSIDQYYFNSEAVDREPYMAPGLVTAEKAKRGKLPTDVWWHTIVSPTGKEKTGYPTQKPLGILKRIINASTRENDVVLDFFAGSGTAGLAAALLNRQFILIDQNPEAIEVIKKRLQEYNVMYEFEE
jgi:site-specific DNA-methyltransferase (adenine-specific)